MRTTTLLALCRRASARGIPARLVLAAATVAVLTWIVLLQGERSTASAETAAGSVAGGGATVRTDAVGRYATFVMEHAPSARGEPNVTYTVAGIRSLADALGEIIARDDVPDDLRTRPAELRALAERISGDEDELARAIAAREAFTTAARAVTAVQRRRYPHLDRAAVQVRWAARRVSARRPLSMQEREVRRFLERTSDALLAMEP